MLLLHPEIEVMPGRRAQHPHEENPVGPGSALLRVSNTTMQENAYIIRLQCDDPLWQDDWYQMKAVSPVESELNGQARGEDDQYGPNRRWVKIFLTQRATRDIVISFNLPHKPQSRAGIYPFKVLVETFVNEAGARNRQNRFHELPGVAIVRPFYKWNVDLSPEEGRRAGRLWKRSGTFDVVITNESNDWLYCDMLVPREKDLELEAPTLRVAVPPPEPDEEFMQRVIPLRATTRLKTWRGDTTDQALPISLNRVEAPSVPPREEGTDNILPLGAFLNVSNGDGSSFPAVGAVVASETNDVATAPRDRALHYNPPFPGSLTGFFGGMSQGVKGIAMLALSLCALYLVSSVAFEMFWRTSVIAEPLTAQVAPGGDLTLAGKYLIGSRVYINDNTEAEALKARSKEIFNPIAKDILRVVQPGSRQYVTIKVDERYNGQKIKLTVQRAGVLSFLSPLLPRYVCRTRVQVGRPPVVIVQRSAATGGQYAPGAPFTIRIVRGPALKGKPKSVGLGGVQAAIKSWTPQTVVAVVPNDAPLGPLQVTLQPSDGGNVTVTGAIQVVAAGTVPGADAAGSAVASAAAGGAAAPGGSSGGASGGGGGAPMPALPSPALDPMPLAPSRPLPPPLPKIEARPQRTPKSTTAVPQSTFVAPTPAVPANNPTPTPGTLGLPTPAKTPVSPRTDSDVPSIPMSRELIITPEAANSPTPNTPDVPSIPMSRELIITPDKDARRELEEQKRIERAGW
jgi:uncharacterized membrane protein YgcG